MLYISITKLLNDGCELAFACQLGCQQQRANALQQRASSIDQLAWRFELPRASQQRRANALQRRASSVYQLAWHCGLPRASQFDRSGRFEQRARSTWLDQPGDVATASRLACRRTCFERSATMCLHRLGHASSLVTSNSRQGRSIGSLYIPHWPLLNTAGNVHYHVILYIRTYGGIRVSVLIRNLIY